MFCTKCSAEMLDGDRFCPRCGAPQKIRDGAGIDEEIIRKTAATVDITPDETAEASEYIGQHRSSSGYEQTYSGYYESMEETERKRKSGCFLRFVLASFFAVLVIVFLFCGVLLIKGENPVEYAKNVFNSIVNISDTDLMSQSDAISETDVSSGNIILSDPSILSTTTSTTMFTTKNSTTTTTTTATTTTKKTTTTTKPTTGTTSVGQQVKETSVGKWTADISALNIQIMGSKIKSINISIDSKGNANVDFKLGFVKVKTTGSFTVENNGKTELKIKVPYSGENITVVGYSKVVNKNQIVFRCSEGDITLNRK